LTLSLFPARFAYVDNRPSFRRTVATIGSWLYSCWWECKRYGWISHLNGVVRFLVAVILPLGIAAELALRLVENPAAAAVQWAAITILAAIAFFHLVSFVMRRGHHRPEVRDVYGVRRLNLILQSLLQDVSSITSVQTLESKTRDLLTEVVKIACEALCDKENLRGTIMLFARERSALIIKGLWPDSSDLDTSFCIPISGPESGQRTPEGRRGMAGFSFVNDQMTYLPNRHFRTAWYIDCNMSGEIEAVRLGDVWQESQSRRFCCVLSAPIYIPHSGGRLPFGVLNLESKKWDAFSDADFHLMGIVADAFGIGLSELAKQNNKLSVGDAIPQGVEGATS